MQKVKKLIAYMVTWTTYGTWLQGDERKYVKNGEILQPNEKLKTENQEQQKFQTITLNKNQRQIAEQAIRQEAKRINQKILALAVCANHIHLLAEKSEKTIEQTVHNYKYAATAALRKAGLQNKIWTKGFDKRFCYQQQELQQKIKYIQDHKK